MAWQIGRPVYFTMPDVIKDLAGLPITDLTTSDFVIQLNDAADTDQTALVTMVHQTAIPGLYGGTFTPLANPGTWRGVVEYVATGTRGILQFDILAAGTTSQPGDDTSGIYTLASIKEELEQRRFPHILTTNDYNGILKAALREMSRYSRVKNYASFLTVAGVQHYSIFNPDDAITLGFAQNALSITDVWWNPGGDWSSMDIFAPGWEMMSQVLITSESYWHNPSAMLLFRQKLDGWRTQFGSQGHEIIGVPGDPAALLRIFPVPHTDNGRVVVEFQTGHTLSTIKQPQEDQFYNWVEYYACETLANLYATTAGIDLLGFADSTAAMNYWERKAKRLYTRAMDIQGGVGGEVLRS